MRILRTSRKRGLLPDGRSRWERDGSGEKVSVDLYGWVPGLACFQTRVFRKGPGGENAQKEISFWVADGREAFPVPEGAVLNGIDRTETKVWEPFPHLERILPQSLKERVSYPAWAFPLPVCPLWEKELMDYPYPFGSDLAWAVAKGESPQTVEKILNEEKGLVGDGELQDALAWSLVWRDREVMGLLLDRGASPDFSLGGAEAVRLLPEAGIAALQALLVEREAADEKRAGESGEDMELLL